MKNGQSSLIEWSTEGSRDDLSNLWVLNPSADNNLEMASPTFHLEQPLGEKKPRFVLWDNGDGDDDSDDDDDEEGEGSAKSAKTYYLKATTLDSEGYSDISQSVWTIRRA